jgi:tRNA (guanine6-N2)-methyltransferase
VARKAGQHAYRRVDLQRAVELGILDRLPAWRLVEDNAQVEAWAQLVGSRLIVGFRLSDIEMRQREYRRVSLPAALKPSIARAMVLLSEPRDYDVFLDPMCGSGTILIERALTRPYRLLLGGDEDPKAVEATRANIGPRYKPIEIRRWDARSLPLKDASVSALATNLPFGKQIGTQEDNRSLYPALLREWARVVQPGGRMVLLTSEERLLRETLRRRPELVVRRKEQVIVRGMRAALVTIRRA